MTFWGAISEAVRDYKGLIVSMLLILIAAILSGRVDERRELCRRCNTRWKDWPTGCSDPSCPRRSHD